MSTLCDNCGKSERLHFCYGEGNLDCYFHPSERRERTGHIALAIEYGYRALEKGQSLQQALEILAESDEFQKIFWTPDALMADLYGRTITPQPTPSSCATCGCVDSVNLNCANHIILWRERI